MVALQDQRGETPDPMLLGEVVATLPEGIVLFDADGRIFYANRAVEELLGVTREAVLGRHFDDPEFSFTTLEGQPLPPEDRPVGRVLRTGDAVLGVEYQLEVMARPPLTLSQSAVPLRLEGELAGVAVSFTDITDRVRAESALQESDERFRAIVDQSRYGIVISSPDGEVLVYNHAMEQINGHSFDEVKAKGWLEAAFPDPVERQHVAEQAMKSIRGELPYVEEPYTRPDGRQIWVSYASSTIHLKGKDYALVIVGDITERQQAEARVRFQSRLLDEVRNAVVATDMSGRVSYVNSEAERLFARDQADMIGRDMMGMLRPAATDRTQAVMADVMSGGRWEGEATFTRSDGSEVPVLLSLGLMTDAHGMPEGFVGVTVDISDIKSAEAALLEKDRAIRQAYVDVVGAVTGGKLVLLTEDEFGDALGDQVDEDHQLRPDNLAASRHEVLDAMREARTAADPATAVVAYGEAATNALKHAGGGVYRLCRADGMLQVVVCDTGPGIDFRLLPKATLMPGFSSTQSLGMGFSIMLDLADRVLLATGPGHTEIALEFALA